MPRTKKVTITVELAEELEAYIGEYLSMDEPDGGEPFRFARNLLKQAGVPKQVIDGLKSRCDSIGQDLEAIRGGDVERMLIDAVSEDLKHLDEYLGKVFNVTGMPRRRGRVHPYVWEVWG